MTSLYSLATAVGLRQRRAGASRAAVCVVATLGSALVLGCGAEPREGAPSGGEDTGGSQVPLVPSRASAWTLEEAVVVFERRGAAGSVLFAVDRATGVETRLTPAASRNWAARMSPSGDRMLFVSLRDGDYELYVSAADGSDARNVTNHPDYDIVGAWSPDGGSIAFMSTRGYVLGGEQGPFPGHVYVARADGTELRTVTREPLTSSLGPSDWSPDGRWLAMGREFDGQVDVVLLDAGTGEERRVTSNPASEYGATFSPDGMSLAFHADDGEQSSIVVTDLDGGERRTLTSGTPADYQPSWSPDGSWLLVTRRGPGDTEQYDVIAVSVDDGRTIPIVTTEADERSAAWMPDR